MIVSQASLVAFSAWLLSLFLESSSRFQDLVQDIGIVSNAECHLAVILYMMTSAIIVEIFLMSLGGFHMFLCMKQLTTYEYVCKSRNIKVSVFIIEDPNVHDTSTIPHEQVLVNQQHPDMAKLAEAVNNFNLERTEEPESMKGEYIYTAESSNL